MGVVGHQRHVLGGQRVDGRRHHLEGDAEPVGGVGGHRVDRPVVAADEGQQIVVEGRVGRRGVDVAAPDPACLVVAADRRPGSQRARLGIVDHDEVVVARELLGVAAIDLLVERADLVGELDGRALQAVVEALRDVEELAVGRHDLPLGLQADIVHQRQQRVEDLGDPAAERGRVDVQDALALKRRRELLDLGEKVFEDDALVVGQELAACVDVAHVRLRFDGTVVHHIEGAGVSRDRGAQARGTPCVPTATAARTSPALPTLAHRAGPRAAEEMAVEKRTLVDAARGRQGVVRALAQAEPPQAQAHGLDADVEPVGQAASVGAVVEHRLADELHGHEELGGELVGLALEARRRPVGRAAALGHGAILVEQEVADLVGDREPQTALTRRPAQLDGVTVAQGHERRLGAERLATPLDEREVEKAHDVAQRDRRARGAGGLEQPLRLVADDFGRSLQRQDLGRGDGGLEWMAPLDPW